MPHCLALLLSSFLGLPLCPRMNKDRGDCLPVSVFYGENRINTPFTRHPNQNTARLLRETAPESHPSLGLQSGTKRSICSCKEAAPRVSAEAVPRFQAVPKLPLAAGGSSDDQRCSPSPYLGFSLVVNSHTHISGAALFPYVLRVVRKYNHASSYCRVAYPPTCTGQTHVKISQRYQMVS